MKTLHLYRHDFKAMGSPCHIQLYAESQACATRYSQLVVHDIERLEARYSRYRPTSYLSEINRVAAVGGKICVDEETASLLNYAATCYHQSDGLFDITSGVLRKIWRFDQALLPSHESISETMEKIGWHKLRWASPLLCFPFAGMELDFGGIVKEYAVDRVANLLAEAGVRSGLVNLGGDIKIIGPQPNGAPWQIGIRHPRSTGELIHSLALHRGGLTSSGDYERCMLIDGVRYGHILNPKTGWPVQHLASVSVVSDFCVIAGSASTIAMLKESQGPRWLEELGLPHFWVDVAGNTGGTLLSQVSKSVHET